jgi:hypothetical protein
MARDWKGTSPNAHVRKTGVSRCDQLPVAVDQAEKGMWPTPCAMEAEKAGLFSKGQMGQSLSAMANRGELGLAAPANLNTNGSRCGLLNPDWVETLMGLPVGWTDSACLATESCQQLPKEHFKF